MSGPDPRVIDLSHPITSGMTVFPGDPAVAIAAAAEIDHDGFRVSSLHLGSHSGTHVDAPSHTRPDGAAIDAVPLETFIGPLRVLRALGRAPREVIAWADLEPQARDAAAGDIVVIATGWHTRFGTPEYLEHPVIAPEIAEHLIARGVRVIGVDLLNPDPSWPGDDGAWSLPVHDVVLGAGAIIIENLANLDAAPDAGATAIVLPLNLPGIDGSPVRAVAVTGGPLH